jgi:glutamyl/glutaminyl-tRNA synthetase
MQISHVIRGEDHLTNTAKHVELYQALGVQPPHFAHIPLILNQDGSKMSKRDAGATVTGYMEQGYAPEAVRNYLCLLGWSPKDNREKIEIEEVVELFDLKKINRRNAAFDLDKCFWLNGQYVSQMSLNRFRALSEPFIQAAHLVINDEDYLLRVLEIIKEKVKLFKDVPDWISYFFIDDYQYDPDAVSKTFKEGTTEKLRQLAQRYRALPSWGVDVLEAELKKLASELGCKTGELIHPTRLAVSGRSVGPSLYHMLEVLGRERVLTRLEKTAVRFS